MMRVSIKILNDTVGGGEYVSNGQNRLYNAERGERASLSMEDLWKCI